MTLKFTSRFVASQIDTLLIMNAINDSKSRIQKGLANAALQRWFGDQSQQWKDTAIQRLETMRKIINLQDITIGVMDLNERSEANANALPGSATSIVPGSNSDYKGRQVLLDTAFNTLPRVLPMTNSIVDQGQWDQDKYFKSKFETVLHELSHAIISTNDELLANGENAYGTYNALLLVGESPALAKTNAENWGIFIEACGRDHSS
jgi:hypothetical protein